MRVTILVFFLAVFAITKGQYNFKEHYFERNKAANQSTNYVEFSGNYMLNSTSLTNKFTKTFLNSGFIDETLKNDNLKKVGGNNLLGLGLGGTISYKKVEKGFNLTSSVGTHFVSSANFSGDLYQLLFYGNQPTAGQNMSLKNTSAFISAYNKLTLGAEKTFKENFFGGFSLNIYQSLMYHDAKVSRGDFYTQPDGEQLNVGLKYSQLSSNPKDRALGAGLDFYLMSKHKKGNVSLHVQDLGFIAHKNLNSYEVDSNYAFRGLEIDNIFDVKSLNFNNSNGKSLYDIMGMKQTSVNKKQFLPTKVTLGMQELIGEHGLLELYVNYQFIQNYIPQMIIKPNYFFNKNLSLAPIVNVGGFGKADLGFNVSYHHTKYLVNLDVLELENVLLAKQSSGRALFLRLGYML